MVNRARILFLCLIAVVSMACQRVPSQLRDAGAIEDAPADGSSTGDAAIEDAPASDAPANESSVKDAAAESADARIADLQTGLDAFADQRGRDLSADATAWLKRITCATPPPPGAALAAPLPLYAGKCPALAAGRNAIVTSGKRREFLVLLPKNRKPNEVLPVLFLWHWLKGNANKFAKEGQVQSAVDAQRFIAVIPESSGDISLFGAVSFPWPFLTITSDARMKEEYVFFDDTLACVAANYNVNKECVATAGVSAGALFSSQLAAARSERISSLISLSGGIGDSGGISNAFIRKWKKQPSHRFPALVLWGGPGDSCGLVNFQAASQALEASLAAGGHFLLECVHNCKHAQPPVKPLAGSRFQSIWDFAFKHPFWLPPGQSPLQGAGQHPIPWCAIGKGSAVARTGTCPSPACPI